MDGWPGGVYGWYAPVMAEQRTFDLTVGADRKGTLLLDGQDISRHVRSVELSAHAGQPAVLALGLLSAGSLRGEGIVLEKTQGLPASTLLDQLNPQSLEILVNELMANAMEEMTVGQAIIAALRLVLDKTSDD